MLPANLASAELSEIFSHAAKTGRLSEMARQGLLAARQDASLDAENRNIIDRLLYAISRGWVAVG